MKTKSLLDQWIDLKEDFPKHIILIQCGVFYETYQKDAEILAEITNIKNFLRGPCNVAGFPIRSIDKYRGDIENIGYAVVIVTEIAWDGNSKIRGIEYVTGNNQISLNVQTLKREIRAEDPKKKAKKTVLTVQTAQDLKATNKVDIALTQIGYMFNAFEGDAQTLSQKIGLKSFDKYGFLTVGFPVNAKETYFKKILDADLSFLTIVETGKGGDGSIRLLGEVFTKRNLTNVENKITSATLPIKPIDHNSLKSAALGHAKNGLYVIPLVENSKRPLISDWQNRATTNPLQIESWWNEHPNANIGIACEVSNLIIIDLDTSKGAVPPAPWQEKGIQDGEGVFKEVCHQASKEYPSSTYTVITPSGGKHLYFYDENEPIKQGAQVNGWWRVDTRSRGGYIVAEGSRIRNGDTGVTESYISGGKFSTVHNFPEWLRKLISVKNIESNPNAFPITQHYSLSQKSNFSREFAEQILSERCALIRSTPEGSRNQLLVRHATYIGKIIASGALEERTATTSLLEAAIQSGLTKFEAVSAIKSGLSYGKKLLS